MADDSDTTDSPPVGIGVTHTLSGDVVVVVMASGDRFDLTPDQALRGAAECEAMIPRAGRIAVNLAAKDGRMFRFEGDSVAMAVLANDLRTHAGMARLRSASTDGRPN